MPDNFNLPNLLTQPELVEILDIEAIQSDKQQEQDLLFYFNSLAQEVESNDSFLQ